MLTATATRPQKALLWLMPSLFTLALLAFARVTASDPHASAPLWVRLIPGVLGVAIAWFSSVLIPRRVTVNGSQLVLERPIGDISVPIGEIHRVNASPWNHGFVTVAANKRRVFLLRNTRNLSVVVAEITRQNPRVKVIGEVPHVA
jgi:hypothetical protein